MHQQQQYVFQQQSQTTIQKYQQILSIWSQLNQIQKQEQIFQVCTQSHIINKNSLHEINQYLQRSCDTGEGICSGKLMEILKFKFYVVFTEYVQNTRKLLVNVEFEGRGMKRCRKLEADCGELIIERIESNYLFSQEEIRIFSNFLQKHEKINQLIADFMGKVQSIFADEILYCLYTVCLKIEQLLILDQQHKNNMAKLSDKVGVFSHEIMGNLFDSSKIKELVFEEYEEQYKCKEQIQKYFQELLKVWVNILVDLENNNEDKYKEQIEDAEAKVNVGRTWRNDSSFDFREEDGDEDWRSNHGRKVRPTYL